MHLPHRPSINHGIIVQPATQRSEHIAEIGLREGITKAISKCEQAATGLKEVENGLYLLLREERPGIAAPAFTPDIVTARGRGQDEQFRFRQMLRERFALSGAALKSEPAKHFCQPSEVGVHFPRRESRLCPVRLTMIGIKQGDGDFECGF